MQYTRLIDEKVRNYYWNDDLNCATTTLMILAEIFHLTLDSQIIDAAIGIPGAGRYGAQCGLVSGALMFIGIQGKENGFKGEDIVNKCNNFAEGFEEKFGSLNCRELRPEGFKPENPPHLCEDITRKAIMFMLKYLNFDGDSSNSNSIEQCPYTQLSE